MRGITSFDGAVIAPGGDYPNGQILDAPNGTRINRKSNADMIQFFQRIAQNAGITPNGLEDNANASNGFQMVQALNTLYSRADSALAATVGAGAATNLPVLVTGCGLTTAFGNTFLGTGFLYYNGQLLYAPAGLNSIPTPSGGNSVYLTVNTVDALPTLGIASFATGTPNDSAKFAYSSILTYKQGLAGTWISAGPLTFGASWSNVNLKYRLNAMGVVEFSGSVRSSGSSPSTTILTMPSGFIAANIEEFICTSNPFPSGTAAYCHISALTSGGISIDSADIGGSITIFLSPVRYSVF